VLWPANEDCYRRVIFQGQEPEDEPISAVARATLGTSLAQLKGAARTEYADPGGAFFVGYRSLYKRFAGDSPVQIHYLRSPARLPPHPRAARLSLAPSLSPSTSPGLLPALRDPRKGWCLVPCPWRSAA
jgi:hypothetical protein